MALSRTAMVGIGVGVVVVIVVVVALFGLKDNNTETRIVLYDNAQGQCIVHEDKKEPSATLKMTRRMTWRIDDQCRTKGTLVTVGNFRRINGPSSARHCREAVEGSNVFWPFAEPQAVLRLRQGTSQGNSRIELHAKGRIDFASAREEYDYDICTGANAERKSDPRLVIEE
ncbi:hypothetical protein BH23ACI1_BH23ACI1_32710 [soil metagenome]